MAFKSLAAVVAVALVALAPVQETNALSIVSVAHGSSLFSRTPHSGLTRRAAKAGKRCPKYRSGQPSSITDLNSTSTTVSTTSQSKSVPAASAHTTNNTPSSSPATSTTKSTTHDDPKPSSTTHDDPTPSSTTHDDPKPSSTTKATTKSSTTAAPTKSETKDDTPVKTTTKTSTTPAAPKPTMAYPSSDKVGMIFTGSHPGFLKKASSAMGGKIWATYNWGANKPDEADAAGVPFIPMLWGPKTFDDWGVVKKGYAKAALGCNEVNQVGQAQMSVSDGIAAWKKYMAPLIDDGYTLYSHSVSNAPSGMDWWDQFKDQCAECHNQIGAMAVHYYSNSADGMIAYLQEVHSRYGKNLVVTEFGCANWSGQGAVSDGCSPPETEDFYRAVTAFMDKSSFVVGYLGFGFFTTSDPSGGVPSANAFYNNDGSFTDVGKAYAY